MEVRDGDEKGKLKRREETDKEIRDERRRSGRREMETRGK